MSRSQAIAWILLFGIPYALLAVVVTLLYATAVLVVAVRSRVR